MLSSLIDKLFIAVVGTALTYIGVAFSWGNILGDIPFQTGIVSGITALILVIMGMIPFTPSSTEPPDPCEGYTKGYVAGYKDGLKHPLNP